MGNEPRTEPIRTRRLELVVLTNGSLEALVSGDLATVGRDLDASVGQWLARDPSHVIQLGLAARAAAAEGVSGVARMIVLTGGPRSRVVGSIGLHWPPDDRGRIEVSSRIHPAFRRRGYGAEALTSLLDWATARFGIRCFLVAVSSQHEGRSLVPIDIDPDRASAPADELVGLADLVEGGRRAR